MHHLRITLSDALQFIAYYYSFALQEKEVAQSAACGSFMRHFSFSSTIIYDTSNQKKIQRKDLGGIADETNHLGLMYRSAISVTYKRKIENIVRKPEKTEEEESLAPCPTCSLEIPETQLDCPTCRCTIPVNKRNLSIQPSLSLFLFTFLPVFDVQLILLPIDVNFQVQSCKLF